MKTRTRSWECISPPSKFLQTLPFSKNFKGSCLDCPWKHAHQIWNPYFTVLELLAFNTQTFRGSRDPGHAPFWENFWGHVRTVPGNIKFVSNLKSVAITMTTDNQKQQYRLLGADIAISAVGRCRNHVVNLLPSSTSSKIPNLALEFGPICQSSRDVIISFFLEGAYRYFPLSVYSLANFFTPTQCLKKRHWCYTL